MRRIFKKFKKVEGVTLLELTVAVGLFAILILSATGIFKIVLDGQRNSLSAQNVQENMRYVLEKMSKEIRMATESNTDCLGAGVNKVYNTASGDTQLYFKNEDGVCVSYYLEAGRIKTQVGTGGGAAVGFVTPVKISVESLKFYAVDNAIGTVTNTVQPYLTVLMDVEAVAQSGSPQSVKLQNTVSSRYYE